MAASRLARGLLLAGLVIAGPVRPVAAQSDGAGEEAPEHTTLVYPPFAHTLGIHRARPVHLKVFLGDRTRFDDPQGVAAVKFTSDDDPEAKGDDYQLTLFGVNSGRGELLYNSSMQTLAIYGGQGSGPGKFSAPRGVAATVDGRIYVADTGNRRVARLRWDPVGRKLDWVGEWSAPGPFDVATDQRGNVWAADPVADAVLRFAESTAGAGSSLLPPSPIDGDRWPLPEDVEGPTGLAIGDSLDPWYHPPGYRLYLVDRDGGRLRAYDAEGEVLAEIRPADLDRPDDRPGRFGYVELDYYGNVYVSDPVAEVLYKLDPALEPLATFPGPGPATERLEEPRGVAIWPRFGQVFVAERDGARYFFVGTDLRTNSDAVEVRVSEDSAYAFDVFLTEMSFVNAAFLDAAGDTLAFAEAGTFGPGRVTIGWSAEDWTEAPPTGFRERVERVEIEARPTYSSRKRFSLVRTFAVRWNRS
ncbi:MAG: NHL repeat-containing protein [Gemmatimonadota bacterium]